MIALSSFLETFDKRIHFNGEIFTGWAMDFDSGFLKSKARIEGGLKVEDSNELIAVENIPSKIVLADILMSEFPDYSYAFDSPQLVGGEKYAGWAYDFDIQYGNCIAIYGFEFGGRLAVEINYYSNGLTKSASLMFGEGIGLFEWSRSGALSKVELIDRRQKGFNHRILKIDINDSQKIESVFLHSDYYNWSKNEQFDFGLAKIPKGRKDFAKLHFDSSLTISGTGFDNELIRGLVQEGKFSKCKRIVVKGELGSAEALEELFNLPADICLSE